METKSIDRLAYLATVFGVGQFLLLTFLAALFYPGDYDYFGYYFSDLGAVEARNGEPNSISRSFFSVALTIIALSLIPFWLIMHACKMLTKHQNEIDMVKRNPKEHSSAFYIIQKL